MVQRHFAVISAKPFSWLPWYSTNVEREPHAVLPGFTHRRAVRCPCMDAAINPAQPEGPEHMVTLRVPDVLYERVQHAAEALKRSLEDVVLLALATALPPLPELPRDVADELGALAFLDDAALLDVARSTSPPELGAEMDALLADKGRGELGTTAGQRLDELVRAH
jgi:hypothetical protein